MENAFTPCPVCSPARASFHTGRIPSVHGIHVHIGEQSVGAGHPGIAGQTSFAEVLQGQGYQTGLVGKWHLNHFRQPPPGWEVRAGMSFDVLKNADAVLGRVLARAAQRENHVLYAAIFSIYECGTMDESGDFPGWDEPEDLYQRVRTLLQFPLRVLGRGAPARGRTDRDGQRPARRQRDRHGAGKVRPACPAAGNPRPEDLVPHRPRHRPRGRRRGRRSGLDSDGSPAG